MSRASHPLAACGYLTAPAIVVRLNIAIPVAGDCHLPSEWASWESDPASLVYRTSVFNQPTRCPWWTLRILKPRPLPRHGSTLPLS